jgi:hypothetical protein
MEVRILLEVFGDRANKVMGLAEQVQQKRPLSNPISSFMIKYKSFRPLQSREGRVPDPHRLFNLSQLRAESATYL